MESGRTADTEGESHEGRSIGEVLEKQDLQFIGGGQVA